MRPLSAAESVRVASGAYAPAFRVSLEDAGGVFRDVDSYFGDQRFLMGVSIQEDVDGQGPTASIQLRRQVYEHSLSPLMLSSGTARGYVPSASPAPPVALYRRVRVEFYIGAVDELVTSPTWTELFVGRIDSISVADGESVTLQCRDATVAVLSDSFYERERLYGLTPTTYAVQRGCLIWAPSETQAVGDLCVPTTLNGYLYRATSVTTGFTGTTQPSWPTAVGATVVDGGVTWTCGVATAAAGTVTMEGVLQQMLNDSPVSVSLYAPDASSFLMSPWKQEREPVLEAMRKVTQLIGWDLRPRYDSGGSWRLQLYRPDRAASVPVWTFAPSNYVDVSALDMGIEDVRNVVRVIYGDSADLGTDGKTPRRKYRQAVDSASIAAYGRRFMEIAEEATSAIDTSAEADALASAALADLSTPYASLGVEAFFFPWVQLGDLYRFSANNVHFDADQVLAVVGYSHEAQLGSDGEQTFRTSLTCRGKPSGGSDRWLQWDSRPGVAPAHSLQDSMGGVTLGVVDAAGVAGGAKFRIDEKLSRLAKFDGVELHVSASPGFAPAAGTLAAFSKAESLEVQNLIPGRTYYARAVPRQLNAGRIVQGQPSAEVSFTAGYAAPRLLQPGVDYGDVPANGGFEAFTLGTANLPDAWDIRSGTWGSDVTAWSLPTSGLGVGGFGSWAVAFAANSTGRLASRLFSVVQYGVYRLATSVLFYHPTSSPAANSVRAEVEWLSSAGAVLSTSSLDLSTVSGTEFVIRTLELAAPTGAAFARVVGGRYAATASAETFAWSDVRVDRLIDPRTNGVSAAAIVDGSVTSAKLDLNIAVAGTLASAAGATFATSSGNVGIGTATTGSFRLAVRGPSVGTATGVASFRTPGAAQGERSALSLYPTFQATADNDPRRAADVVAGFNGGAWGTEYLAFNVGNNGSSNDTQALTAEKVRIQNNGNVGIGVSAPEEKLEVRTSSSAYGLLHSDGTVKVGTYVSSSGGEIGTKSSHAFRFFTGGAARALLQAGGHFVPNGSNTYTLGANGALWKEVFSNNNVINTSDERLKDNIKDSDLGLSFIEALRPVSYRWKVGQNVQQQVPDGENEDGTPRFREETVPVPGKRPHYGFIAQHVEEVLGGKDFAGLIYDEDADVYGLRYGEFVAPLVMAVQELSSRVKVLEQQLAELQQPQQG